MPDPSRRAATARQCQSRSMEWQKRSRRPGRDRANSLHMALSDAAARCDGARHGRLRLAAGHGARSSRSRWSSTRRTATATRCTGTTTSRSRWCSRAAASSCSAGGRCAAEPGDIFFIDNSQPHVALADPGPAAAPAARPVPARSSSPGPAAGELDPGYLAPFRGRRAAPARRGSAAATAARGRGRAASSTSCAPSATATTRPSATSPTPPCASRSRWSTATRAPARRAGAARAAADRREQIRPVLAYVDGHRREQHHARTTSRSWSTSARRASATCSRTSPGVSFKEYVTQVRVAEAKRLLLGTDLSVAEIARAVSYTNLHQFYKVFYRSCAMSPGRVPPLLHAGRRRSGRARSRRERRTAVAAGQEPDCGRPLDRWRPASAGVIDPRGGRRRLGGGRAGSATRRSRRSPTSTASRTTSRPSRRPPSPIRWLINHPGSTGWWRSPDGRVLGSQLPRRARARSSRSGRSASIPRRRTTTSAGCSWTRSSTRVHAPRRARRPAASRSPTTTGR